MSYQDKLEQAHWEEHDRNGFDSRTDYCPRECVADESRGLVGQIAQVWGFVLTNQERDLVRLEYAPEEIALDIAILAILRDQETDTVYPGMVSYIADAIEAATELYWDGDVFRLLPCPLMQERESRSEHAHYLLALRTD